jgi:hypothetical protein
MLEIIKDQTYYYLAFILCSIIMDEPLFGSVTVLSIITTLVIVQYPIKYIIFRQWSK